MTLCSINSWLGEGSSLAPCLSCEELLTLSAAHFISDRTGKVAGTVPRVVPLIPAEAGELKASLIYRVSQFLDSQGLHRETMSRKTNMQKIGRVIGYTN